MTTPAPKQIWIQTDHIPDHVALDKWDVRPDADEAEMFTAYVRRTSSDIVKSRDDQNMTPDQFKAARNALCLSQRDLAEVWGMGQNGERTIRRWEQGDVPVNPIAAYCIALMLDNAA